MMRTIIDLYLLSVLVVYIVDLSGFTQSWKAGLGRILHKDVGRVKPLDCSQCMTWWTCLIYLLIVGQLTLPHIVVSALLSFLSSITNTLLITIYDTLVWVLNRLTQYLNND